jgi:hypothetical protein
MPTAGSEQSMSLCPDDVHSTMPTWLIFCLLTLNSILLLHIALHIWIICGIRIRKGVERSVSGPFWLWTVKYLKTMVSWNVKPRAFVNDPGGPTTNPRYSIRNPVGGSGCGLLRIYIPEQRDVWVMTCGWVLDEYITLKITLAIIIILKRT